MRYVAAIETTHDGTAVLPFEEVYRRHAPAVYRFCLSQVGRAPEAEDITADVFAAAFAAYGRTRPDPDGIRPWLLRIARNATVDHWRRENRQQKLFARLRWGRNEAGPTVDVEEYAMHREDMRRLLACIGRLSQRDRLLVGLRGAAGLPYAEIAAVLGISEHAAVVAGRRAFGRLRSLYGADR